MSYTIEMLKKDLLGFSNKANVKIDGKSIKGLQNLDNGDLYISTTKKLGECKECGHAVYSLENYHGGEFIAFCPQCNCYKTEFQFIKK